MPVCHLFVEEPYNLWFGYIVTTDGIERQQKEGLWPLKMPISYFRDLWIWHPTGKLRVCACACAMLG